MHKKYTEGIFLRLKRIKLEKTMKEVASGICSLSTLSKIETGKSRADDGILILLYKKLGIEFINDEKFINEMKILIFKAKEEINYFKENNSFNILEKNKEKIINSRLALDYYIIEGNSKIDRCYDLLSREDRAWYSAVKSNPSLESLEEAVKILDNSISFYNLAYLYYKLGRYKDAFKTAEKLKSIAMVEGNLYALASSFIIKGLVYATVNIPDLMIEEFNVAIKFLEETKYNNSISGIYYNIGATFLGNGKLIKAKKYLLKVSNKTFSLYHKLSLLYIRLGDYKNADKNYKMMIDSVKNSNLNEIEKIYISLTKLEIESKIESDEAGEYFEELIDLSLDLKRYGIIIFYKEEIKRIFIRKRKYKNALELEELISKISLDTFS